MLALDREIEAIFRGEIAGGPRKRRGKPSAPKPD